MAQTIKCKECGAEIEVSEALTHQLEEQIKASVEAKNKNLLDEYKAEVEKKAARDIVDEKARNAKLAKQVDDLLDEIRALRRRDEEREIEMKKKLFDEEEKIRLEAAKRYEEEHKLKDLEKDKKINDLREALEAAQKKATQGSQQTQGESLELELEERLRAEFPMDEISEVKKGVRGADIVQAVRDKYGRSCGTILWESKNAKWSHTWISKLKEDKMQAKADIAALITVDLPEGLETFKYDDRGVWIVDWRHFISLAFALRYNLVVLNNERTKQDGKDEKMEVMYNYLTGNEFRDKVEGIIESYDLLREDIEREKRWYQAKWSRQEKIIGKIIGNTSSMYGDLKGVIGHDLPQIKTLELPEPE